jgi:hypothetical protein
MRRLLTAAGALAILLGAAPAATGADAAAGAQPAAAGEAAAVASAQPAAGAQPATGAQPAAGVQPAAAAPVEVTMDRPAVTAVLGDRFAVRSTVINAGTAPTGPLLAHLDIVSLHNDVYVDPEDWSSDRSVDVEPLAAGGRTTLEWTVRTVDAGEFDVYVVVLPAGPAAAGGSSGKPSAAALSVSPPLRLAVASRQTLDPGGSAVVALTVPLLVGALVLGSRRRRRPGRTGTATGDAERR